MTAYELFNWCLAGFAVLSTLAFIGVCAWILWDMRGDNNAAGW